MTAVRDLLLAAFSLGFDSLLAGLAIGSIVPSWRGRAWFVLLFGVCDGVATLLGAVVPHRIPEAPVVALYLLSVVLIILGARRSRAWLCAMPVLFSLDNLAAGSPAADAPALALTSAAMAATGIALGALGRWATIRFAVPRALT